MIDRGGEVGDRPTGGPGADGPTGGSARRFPIIVALALALLAAAGVAGLVLRGDHPSGRAGGATAVTESLHGGRGPDTARAQAGARDGRHLS